MGNTKIEWCDEAINPLQDKIKGKSGRGYHCTKVSAGCKFCYAEKINKIRGNGLPFDNRKTKFELIQSQLEKPLKWKKPRRIFIQSMGDLFHNDIPLDYIDRILEVIAACPQHIFIVLTKRPQNLEKKIYEVTEDNPCRELGGGDYLPNLWLGVSVEDQKTADERIPILLQIPAAKRIVSYEPALGPVDFKIDWLYSGDCADWCPQGNHCSECHPNFAKMFMREGSPIDLIIAGCESINGKPGRKANFEWFRSAKDQCVEAGVPFFLKQMEVHYFKKPCIQKIPPLDGQIWDQMPER